MRKEDSSVVPSVVQKGAGQGEGAEHSIANEVL